MSNYTKVNLDEIDDMAPKFGLSPGLESHFARVPLELQESGLGMFRLAPDFRVPFGHTHSEQEELYVVIEGSARFKVGDEVVDAGRLEAVRVSPGVIHGMEGGPDGATIIAFGAPNTENKDAEMQQDWW